MPESTNHGIEPIDLDTPQVRAHLDKTRQMLRDIANALPPLPEAVTADTLPLAYARPLETAAEAQSMLNASDDEDGQILTQFVDGKLTIVSAESLVKRAVQQQVEAITARDAQYLAHIRALEAQVARKFKVMGWGTIPWHIAERAYAKYEAKYHTGQTLERLNDRGGFGQSEMDEFVPEWRQLVSDAERVQQLQAENARLEALVREMHGYGYPFSHELDYRVNAALAEAKKGGAGE